MKIKFVEGTLIPEVDKYHFDLQTEKNGKKKCQANFKKSWFPEIILEGKGYHLDML